MAIHSEETPCIHTQLFDVNIVILILPIIILQYFDQLQSILTNLQLGVAI